MGDKSGEKSTPEGVAGLQSGKEDPPFNERHLAWLTTVMAKGTSHSLSSSSKLKWWHSDSLID